MGGVQVVATDVPDLLNHLKLHAPGQQQTILTCYQEAKQLLEQHDKEQLANAIKANENNGDISSQAMGGEDALEPAVQGALILVARLLTQMQEADVPTGKATGNAGLPMSAIATTVGTNLFDLFREWPVVCGKLASLLEKRKTSSRQLEAQGNICEWQKTLVAVALLSKKYKDLFNKYVHCEAEHKALVLKLGWTLYIVLKAKLLPRFPDLVICMELLVCVMNVLVAHIKQLPSDIPPGPDGAVNILDAISDALKADRSHVQQLMISVNPLFTQQLQNQCAGWLNGQVKHPDAPRVRATCTYLPGLLDDAERMVTITASLEREYIVHFQKQGEIDERDMLFMDLSRFASPRMTPTSAYKQAAASPYSHSGPALPYKMPHHHQLLGGPQAQAGQRLGPGSFVSPSEAVIGTPGGTLPMSHLPFTMPSPMPIMQLGPATATPITEAMGSAAWLRGATAGLKSEPSPALQRYFAMCVPNPASTLAKRVKEMTEAVIPSEQQQTTGFALVQPAVASYRREEATKLYYHVLELVVSSEERIAVAAGKAGGAAALSCSTTLLTSSKLHKGLMACSLEIVMACYKMTSCPFPRVLEIINLQAFDLIKIVQTYVRHMPSMPMELKKHLYQMEERTVECLAWQAGSSLYPLIITAQGHTGATSSCNAQPAQRDEPAAATTASANSAKDGSTAAPADSGPDSALTSDVCDSRGTSASAPLPPRDTAASLQPTSSGPMAAGPSPSKRPAESRLPSQPSPMKRVRSGGEDADPRPLPNAIGRPPSPAVLESLHPEAAAALTWLHDFLKKVLKLAWFRLGCLCQALGFGSHDPAHVRQKVYETVEYAVYMHTNLLYNRHLDQVLLSALYGYCKVHHVGQTTFKEIIAHYRKQPQATQEVFRSVIITQTNPGLVVLSRGDIIAFYNQAFVPPMKQYLLKGEAAATTAIGLPPMPPPAGGGIGRQSPRPGMGPGAASPRPYGSLPMNGLISPVGSPSVGRPPLPPDACAVQAAIKQTISGFFPAVPRAPPSQTAQPSPKPLVPGLLHGSLHRGGMPPQAPVWPSSGLMGVGSSGTGQPFGLPPPRPPPAFAAPAPPPPSAPQYAAPLPPAPQPLQQRRNIPSGIATLLRAIDTDAAADAVSAAGTRAKDQSQAAMLPVQPVASASTVSVSDEGTALISPAATVALGPQTQPLHATSSPEAASTNSSAGNSISQSLASQAL